MGIPRTDVWHRCKLLMSRLTLACIVWLLAFHPGPVVAQLQRRVPVVGVLLPVSPTEQSLGAIGELSKGLRELGWSEGQNIWFEYRWAEGQLERLPDLAVGLVRRRVDVIVAGGEPAIRAARRATDTIPIIMAISGDPVGAGLVASLASPGGNVTGLTTLSPELAMRRLELLKETLPRTVRVAVIWNPEVQAKRLDWAQTLAAAQTLGISLHSVESHSPADVELVLAELAQSRIDAAILFAEAFPASEVQLVIDFAARGRLPVMAEPLDYAKRGALMAYGIAQADLFRQSAGYVDKVLKGVKPGDLPVEPPRRIQLMINLKTARALDLTIPPSLLLRADQVIE
jgi:putative tryptophan/tyrosine transport system substrate-binding protein